MKPEFDDGPRFVELEQGSQEWLDWRRSKRTASESPVVMGSSPYQKPLQLARIKRGLAESYSNSAMSRGTKYESEARAFFESELGVIVDPEVMEFGEYAASLDGIGGDANSDFIVEIKVPASEKSDLWQSALRGEVPLHYQHQICHQFAVSGADYGYFVVYMPELKSGKIIKVQPNPSMWAEITAAWDAFWETYMVGELPDEERTDQEWAAACEKFRAAKKAYEDAESILNAAREDLINLAGKQSAKGFGITVSRIEKEGAISYSKAVKELGIDPATLEKYRGKGSISFQVREA